MILTVTLNAALDVTYDVDALVIHGSHRVRAVRERAGGKGVNVASVLHAMGFDAVATGLVGGPTGQRIVTDLATRGLANDFVRCDGESRRTVNVVSAAAGDATIFNEPGPVVTGSEWESVREHLGELIGRSRASVVVLSGSLPRGVPADAYAQLVAIARDLGAQTAVDADGEPLQHALTAHPDIVKPNRAELAAATGERDAVRGARALQAAGARDVVVSAGAGGVHALTRDGVHHRAHLPARLAGNPTGAGDAMVAALGAGLVDRREWSTMLKDAVAWSAAAVLAPLAGTVDPDTVARLLPDVDVETT